ncbi:D-alanyl-D-alanine carboxypeptidase/D-alanyl-D-alanine-endopeptidase [Mucilaginibacter sp.]|uniref:D-alanyl-D-alanine carboxypeptidase/D-alanyl-D-alanine-endopeptidase n=1 Tax=Mucilaginibacter sp. TaxID=1882438 RepID=UPI003AFF650B
MPIKNLKTQSKLAYCFYAIIFASITGCSHQITQHKISKIFNNSAINQNHFTGFALYDQDKRKMIFAQNESKYFTPASNTKLFTFYTALQMLGDSIPGLRYLERNDSLIFWGTGDPSLLHSALKSTKVYDLLKESPKKLFFADNNYQGNFYGEGWPYGDYNDYYQAEINAMPIEDNVAKFQADAQGNLQVKPAYFQSKLQPDTSFKPKNYMVKRALFENWFMYPTGKIPSKFKQEIPWKTSPELTISLLQDSLKKPVGLVKLDMPKNAKTLYSIASDSVYKYMLLPSDNFIAEQLLLVCSSKLSGNLSTQAAINFSKKHFLNDLPDEPQWSDGSGLSRQDLFTPQTLVALLQKIRLKINNDPKLHSLLPSGGVSGTLRNTYKTDNGVPFVWGKTGSLSNVYNQSGYLVTRKGKKLIFSYMNNNFIQPTAAIRAEIARIITEIHNRF